MYVRPNGGSPTHYDPIHPRQEKRVLFNWADQVVAGPACRKLCEAYGAVCQRRFEGHSKGELEKLAARVLERYGGNVD